MFYSKSGCDVTIFEIDLILCNYNYPGFYSKRIISHGIHKFLQSIPRFEKTNVLPASFEKMQQSC